MNPLAQTLNINFYSYLKSINYDLKGIYKVLGTVKSNKRNFIIVWNNPFRSYLSTKHTFETTLLKHAFYLVEVCFSTNHTS